MRLVACVFSLLAVALLVENASSDAKSKRERLAPLGGLVGTWNATGVPAGSKEEQQKGFWTETINCEWQFKKDDAWLKLAFAKGKHFVSGEIRPIPDKDEFEVRLTTTDKATLLYTGTMKGKALTAVRTDADKNEEQKLIFTILHENRILYRYETRAAGKGIFYRKYQVGATKDGVAFAVGDGRPECIVSGGLGTTAVSYMGKTYYVCCSGCRAEFLENPKKYIDEYEAKAKKKSK
ncbi:MAG: YHS domain-containing protein [Gemmataceae bacterium]